MNNPTNKQWTNAATAIVLAKMSSFLKISFVFGSFFTWFSASSIAIPLIGSFGGSTCGIAFFTASLLIRLVFGYGISLKILAFYIPGLCASLYLAQRSALLALGVPLICMIAFIAHPASNGAYIYCAYWLIPMVLGNIRYRSLFTRALTATFIAHAVGSTIWIYTSPTTPAFWITLIPIVAVERFIYATGITLMHKALTLVSSSKKNSNALPLHSA